MNDRYAQRIGMPRAYGYGASMGAWVLDYLTNWAGEWGDDDDARTIRDALNAIQKQVVGD